MVCRASTLASVYGDGIVKDGNQSLDDALLTFTDILNRENNPADSFDRDKLFGLSLSLNNVLNRIDLSGYDTLRTKFQQDRFSMEEIADFINQSSYSFDDVNYIVTDYNNAVTGINTNNAVSSSGNNGVGITGRVVAGPISGYTTGGVSTNFSGELVGNNVTATLTSGGSFTGTITTDNSGPFTGLDGLGNRVDGTFHIGVRPINIGPIGTPVVVPSNTTTSGILDLLNALDFFLNNNFASSITNGICSLFSNMFNKAKELIAKINVAIDALKAFLADPLGSILGFIEDAITGLLGGIAAIGAALAAIVDGLVSTLVNQIKNIASQAVSFIKNLPQNTADMFKKIAEKIRNVQNFFSDVTMDKLKEKIKAFVDGAGNAFEELTAEAIDFIKYRFCQFGEMIQSFMQRPLDAVKGFAQNIQNEQALLQSAGSEQTQQAARAGATRLTDTAIRSAQQRLRSRANRRADRSTTSGGGGGGGGGTSPGAPPPPDPQVYISNNELSSAEQTALINLGPDGTTQFKFNSSVLNMGKSVSDAGDNDGFARVDPNVWVKLTVVGRRMGKQFTVNSGYRSPEYNRRIGGAKRSMHMSGKAIDISTRGWSTEEKADFIRKCSQEGFLGIGTYGTFIHIDIGSRRFWTKGETRYNDYLAMHSRDEFRRGAA